MVEDLDAVQGYDVLLTELKAAAVDTAVARALDEGGGRVRGQSRRG